MSALRNPEEMPFRPYLTGAKPARAAAFADPTIVVPVVDAMPETGFPTLADAMRAHIGEALKRTGGQIEGPAGAAALLGLNPHTLRGKMRKLAIDWASYRATADRSL
jgi:transcriptional regulator with GAF, ATPase, and Fis domain